MAIQITDPLAGLPAPGLSSTSVGEGRHHHVRLGFRPLERETLAVNRVLLFAFVVAAGTIACAGLPSTVKQAPGRHPHVVRLARDRPRYLREPAHAVRGPKYVVKKGKTPVLNAEEARALLDSIAKTRKRI